MSMTSSPTSGELRRLQEEALFADAFYSRASRDLALNETFFSKYARPVNDWDWRQWGAKRLGSVSGCAVLDFGCGAGEESVYLAKMGAKVTAIDVSPVGVRLTAERASFNGVGDRVEAICMRADPTEFPEASFDVVHGFGILHHIGLRQGLVEVKRLLKPGGRGLFFEHMGNSPLLERMRSRHDDKYTDDERPLTWTEITAMAPEFRQMELRAFHLISRLRTRVRFFGGPAVKRLDAGLLAAMPTLRRLASGVVIYIEK
jgi:SAM-dependent methyltransferase